MDDNESLFDRKASSWDENYNNIFYRDRNALLKEWLGGPLKGVQGSALDIGCGTAQASQVYRDFGLEYIGVDRSRNMVAEAKQKRGVSAFVVERARLPFESGSMAVANMFNVIEFVDDPGELLREIRRVLRPGGRFLLTITNHNSLLALGSRVKRGLWGMPYDLAEAKSRYDFKKIRALLSANGFRGAHVFRHGIPAWISSNEFRWYHEAARNVLLSSSIYVDAQAS